VDNLLVTESNEKLIKVFKEQMMATFEMTDLGEMTFFLGMEIQQSKNEFFIGQEKYAKEVLREFKMEECKPVDTPLAQNENFCPEGGVKMVDEGFYRSLIGCLMYLTATKLDIIHYASLLSRFMHCAKKVYLIAAKRVLRYLKGTLDLEVKYRKKDELVLHGYENNVWVGACEDMKSTSGYLFSLGSGCLCWSSRR